jgi:hypothetical protein
LQVYVGNIDFDVELKKVDTLAQKFGEVSDIIMKSGACTSVLPDEPLNPANAHTTEILLRLVCSPWNTIRSAGVTELTRLTLHPWVSNFLLRDASHHDRRLPYQGMANGLHCVVWVQRVRSPPTGSSSAMLVAHASPHQELCAPQLQALDSTFLHTPHPPTVCPSAKLSHCKHIKRSQRVFISRSKQMLGAQLAWATIASRH